MPRSDAKQGTRALVALSCGNLDEAVDFYRDELGFRLETIYPADAPSVAVVCGHGLRIRLDSGLPEGTARLRLETTDPRLLARDDRPAPGGTQVDVVTTGRGRAVPALRPVLVVESADRDTHWRSGRAGMEYRDLIPGRLGGAWIASHIRIPVGGPVPDYVHHHDVRFQLIFCIRGWVRLVYEDQGPPFVMQAGDCVLQPPHIRHRVLECSEGLEVVEICSPAEHVTHVDAELELPTARVDPRRNFAGQRFVFHSAAEPRWSPSRYAGLEEQSTDVSAATGGFARVSVLRPAGDVASVALTDDAEFLFRFVVDGSLRLVVDEGARESLGPGACFVVPAGMNHEIESLSQDLRILEVRTPA